MPVHFMGVLGYYTPELKWPDTPASSFGVSGYFVLEFERRGVRVFPPGKRPLLEDRSPDERHDRLGDGRVEVEDGWGQLVQLRLLRHGDARGEQTCEKDDLPVWESVWEILSVTLLVCCARVCVCVREKN